MPLVAICTINSDQHCFPKEWLHKGTAAKKQRVATIEIVACKIVEVDSTCAMSL